ncbi:hypothetical protein SEVIR_9G493650v4 [Setaria viridis]
MREKGRSLFLLWPSNQFLGEGDSADLHQRVCCLLCYIKRSRSHQHSPALDQQLLVLIRKGHPCRSQGKCHHPCPPEELALLGGGTIWKERKMNLVSFCQQPNGARLLKDCCLRNLLVPLSFSFGRNCQLLVFPMDSHRSYARGMPGTDDHINCERGGCFTHAIPDSYAIIPPSIKAHPPSWTSDTDTSLPLATGSSARSGSAVSSAHSNRRQGRDQRRHSP